jgi:hypothetical protein
MLSRRAWTQLGRQQVRIPTIISQDFSTSKSQNEKIGFRQQMKNMFNTYYFPATVVYGTSYAGLFGTIYLGLYLDVGVMVGFDYPTLVQQVTI